METDFVAVFVGMVVALALFIANSWVTLQHGQANRWLSRGTYVFALIVAGYNMRRYVGDSSSTILIANVIALVCILVSSYRSERNPSSYPLLSSPYHIRKACTFCRLYMFVPAARQGKPGGAQTLDEIDPFNIATKVRQKMCDTPN